MNHDLPFADPAVKAAFDAFPDGARQGLMQLRRLIYAEAAADPRVGPLTEALRWGQPAYLTQDTKAGTTLRLGVPKSGGFAIYTHCQTSVMADFAALSGGLDQFDGTRAVVFRDPSQIDPGRHGALIRLALTYHIAPRNRR